MNDREFLLQAIEQAKESIKQGGFPAGTIVVKDGKIIARGISIGNTLQDPTSHGEVDVIRKACKEMGSSSLEGAIIYSSLEPCMMCLGASMWASVSKIVYACSKSKVSNLYYGGNYDTQYLNKTFLKQIEIIQLPEFEEESLRVVLDWESGLVK